MSNFIIHNLGIKGLDLYISKEEKKYNVLIASCFHGNERSGGYAVVHHMFNINHKDIRFSYIPVCNPTGVHDNTRLNEQGENPNCGFNHSKCNRIMPETNETKCILNNIEIIKRYSKHGFISCHEDKNTNENYSFTYEQTKKPTEFSKRLNHKKFCWCNNTLEDYLYHEGIPITACIEVISKSHMNETLKMINRFIEFVGVK